MTHATLSPDSARGQRLGLALVTLALVGGGAACSKPRPAPPAMSTEENMLAAADLLLECMSSAGLDCVHHNSASDAWSAHGDLELIAQVPSAVLPKYISSSATEMQRVSYVHQRVVEQSAAAVQFTHGLTCKARRARYAGLFFAARRDLLAAQARRLGLPRTAVREDLALLVEAAARLDRVWIVEAPCADGTLFVLVAHTHTLEADDDPAAYPAGGWEAVVAGTDPDALLRGYPTRLPAGGPKLVDSPPDESIDPWLPVTRLDL